MSSRMRFLLGVLLLLATTVHGAAHPADAAAPVVRLITQPGPWIEVDGERHPPLMIFVNSEVGFREVMDNVRSQLEMARDAGIRFVSVPARFPWEVGGMRDYSHLELWFDFILSVYPEAYLIPRVRLDPPMDYWATRFPEELVRYGDGSTSIFSLGSRLWEEKAKDSLRTTIEYIESHPRYASRVVGYHLAYGHTNEWFHFMYREKGNDVSELNRRTFQQWLLDKYGDERSIGEAWGRDEFTLDDVVLYPDPRSYSSAPFLDPDKDRQMLDFFEYTNVIVADRLVEMSQVVKEATQGNRLVVAFYGYPFELPDAHSGHLALGPVLESPYVDILASPFSYYLRGAGELGGFMGPVDSTLLSGKLWVMEDDTRTFLATHTDRDGSYNVYLETLEDSIGVHQRNLGSLIVRGGGVWWMDLWSAGWLNHPALWENIRAMKEVYVDYREGVGGPYRPDVAFIVDEESARYTTQGQVINNRLLFRQREPIYRSGISYGLYLMDDVVKGRLEGPKVYVFLNALHLDEEKRAAIERLQADGNTLVWVYGADLFHTNSSAETIGGITGFTLAPVENRRVGGELQVVGTSLAPFDELSGSVGENLRGAPVYQVLDGSGAGAEDVGASAATGTEAGSAAEIAVLGTYTGDNDAVGFAIKQHDDWTSVFYGSWSLAPDVIRAIADYAGVPVYLESNDVLHTDGRFFSVHASSSGTKRLRFPAVGDVLDPYTGHVLAGETDEYVFEMKKGETTWVIFRPQS